MLTAFAALVLSPIQTTAPSPDSMTLAGRTVAVTYPGPTPTEAPAGFLEWKGWGYRSGALALPKGEFEGSPDLRPYANTVPNAEAKAWRVKIVVFTSTDILDRFSNGLVRQRRGYLGDSDVNDLLASIARFRNILASRSEGKLRFEPDVAIDNELVRGEVTAGDSEPVGLSTVLDWIHANVNGGSYQADDGVYRGPYNGVVAVVPGPFPGMKYEGVVNDTPLTIDYLPDHAIVPGQLEQVLETAVADEALSRLRLAGVALGEGNPVAVNLADVASPGDLPAPLLASYDLRTTRVDFVKVPDGASPVPSWHGFSTQVSFVQDPDRGNVLHYKEASTGRSGGFQLPSPEGGFGSGTLSFFVKSKSTEPLMVEVRGEKTTRYSLGRDLLPPPNLSEANCQAVPFVADGTWQKVALDLRPAGRVESIAIEPTPAAASSERQAIGSVEVDFDAFAITADAAPTPAQAPDLELADAMKAVEAMKTGSASPVLAGLLASPSNLVLLNVLNAYTVVKDPSVVQRLAPTPPLDPKVKNPPPPPAPLPSLETAIASLSPRRQELALRAIANQDSVEGWSFIRRQVLIGSSDIVRGTAAELLAKKDPALYVEPISTLVDNPGRFAKLKAVAALSMVPGPAAKVFLGTFIYHSDPQVKLAVTGSIGSNDTGLLDKAMWSAVNEPWDAVRLLSLEKLVMAKGDSYRAEGYKGVRDDSAWVRKAFVEWMGANPSESHLPALKLALTDSSYLVRAAALKALSLQPEAIKAEDVQALKGDPYPLVRRAYEQLVAAKGLSNP